MKIGIIGAMEEEIRQLELNIKESKAENHYDFKFILGKLGNVDVVLVQSGIGKVNASICTVLIKKIYNVDCIINTGSAGGLDSALKIGDVIIAHSLSHHDVDLTAFGYESGQMAGMPEKYYPDTHLMRTAQQACRSQGIEPLLGLVVSGDQFVADTDKITHILERFPKARACEMESAAIAQVAYVMKVPFVIIRAISDSADEEASLTFDEFIVSAGKKSAEIVMTMIKLLEY